MSWTHEGAAHRESIAPTIAHINWTVSGLVLQHQNRYAIQPGLQALCRCIRLSERHTHGRLVSRALLTLSLLAGCWWLMGPGDLELGGTLGAVWCGDLKIGGTLVCLGEGSRKLPCVCCACSVSIVVLASMLASQPAASEAEPASAIAV